MKSGRERFSTRMKLRKSRNTQNKDAVVFTVILFFIISLTLLTLTRWEILDELVCSLSNLLSIKPDSHIVHIAGIRHLLHVDARVLLHSSQDLAHSFLHQVLDVHKAAPNVAHVIKWGGCRARIPKPDDTT